MRLRGRESCVYAYDQSNAKWNANGTYFAFLRFSKDQFVLHFYAQLEHAK